MTSVLFTLGSRERGSRPRVRRCVARDAQDSIMASDGADVAKGTASSNFAPAKKDAASELAAKTVGLVTKAEFTRVREELEAEAAEPGEASAGAAKKKKKSKKKAASSLSFADDEEAEDAAEEEGAPKKPKLGKNP